MRATGVRRRQTRLFPPPSLDLRFAETKNLVDAVSGLNLITFTRASSATVVNAAGALETVASNVPRFDHNPITGESLGLLVEEARTNGIRNNTMQGAVAGTPGTLPTNWVVVNLGTLTQQIVEVGTVNGVNYIDWRISGTSSTTSVTIGFEPTTQVAASSGQSWSHSCSIARVAGSSSNVIYCGLGIYERASTGSLVVANNAPINLANITVFNRQSYSATLSGGATVTNVQPLIVLSITSGAAIDITLRIGLPQLEQGAFATSVIPTTTAAATRSADVVSITGANFSSWYRQDEGTVFAEATNRETYPGANVFPYLAQVDDGTNNNRVSLDFSVLASGYRYNLAVVSGGSTQFEIAPFGITQNSARWAAGLRSSDFASAVSVSPGTVFTNTSGTLPGVMTQLRIGAGFGKAFSGTIRHMTYWPARLPNTTLQALTR